MVMFSVSEKLFMVGLTLLRVGLVMVTRKKVVILGVTLLGVVLFMLSRVCLQGVDQCDGDKKEGDSCWPWQY